MGSQMNESSSSQSPDLLNFPASVLQVRSPRSGQVDLSLDTPSSADLVGISQGLRISQVRWAKASIKQRADTLLKWKAELTSRRDALIDALVKDTGRYTESVLEVDLCLKSFDRWAMIAQEHFTNPSERPASIPGIHLQQRRIPYPIVGVISPWNFPLLLAMIDTIPALLAGCSVFLKPSEITPRFINILNEAALATPHLCDVVAIVTGGVQVGQAIVQLSDYICFTGSVTTGRKVAEACAARFIPSSLELGGKDPAIVLEGSDIERVSAALCWGGMVNAGQSCLSIERVYVHESLYPLLTQRLAQRVNKLTLNDQDLHHGQIGPIIAERQVEIIRAQLTDAVNKGAQVICGGEIVQRGGGLYCLPTVLTEVTSEMLVMTDETFGPILPLMSFSHEHEAISLANGTCFGLSGAVFGADENQALRVAQQLIGGAISVQDAALTSMVHEAEKHAFKLSGLGGSRMGAASLTRFTRSQALMINRNIHHNPWWF